VCQLRKSRLTQGLAGAFVPLSFSRPVCIMRQLDGELIRARITNSSSNPHKITINPPNQREVRTPVRWNKNKMNPGPPCMEAKTENKLKESGIRIRFPANPHSHVALCKIIFKLAANVAQKSPNCCWFHSFCKSKLQIERAQKRN